MNAPRSQGRRFTPTRVIAIAVIAVLGAGLGWLRFAPDTAPVSVPVGAHAGELKIKPCTYATDDGSFAADCGTLVVPENRADPRSRLIALPVIRIHARSATPDEPIFRFEGGPGLTNMTFPQASRFAGDHDVVLVGYRGVDGSVRLDCPEVTSALKRSGDLLAPVTLRSYTAGVGKCADRLQASGVDLAGYSLPQRVDDMEVARKALGYRRVDLISESAGTRTAMIYSWRYPASIHRSVLIGVNPPGHFLWDPDTIERQIGEYSTLCAADPDCGTSDLAASMRQKAGNLPGRWYGLTVKPGNVRLATFFGLMNSTPVAAPISAPMTLNSWTSAAKGDPSGLWFQSLMADLIIPTSHVWGDVAATGNQDAAAIDAYYAHRSDDRTILGNPGTDHITGGGGLAHAWPVTSADREYSKVQRSSTETLLISGVLDGATPAQNATRELLPYLSNGHQVLLAGVGHTDDIWSYQKPAGNRLINTFFDSGRVDNSFTPSTVDFAPSVSQGTIAKIVLATMVGFAVLALVSLLLMASRVRRRGGFGPKGGAVLRSVFTPVLGLGGWFLGALIALSLLPSVSVDNELLVVVSVGLPVGLGSYLGWVKRGLTGAARRGGYWAALGAGLVGAWLGSGATGSLFAVLTAIIGAVAAANLALISLDVWLAGRMGSRESGHSGAAVSSPLIPGQQAWRPGVPSGQTTGPQPGA
jgi:pimeloyl-ACP methyl ester carboxylesterase